MAFPAFFNLSSLTGENGFIVDGLSSRSALGTSVSRAGDINNDGLEDILIGAPGALSGKGQAYVIFGRSTTVASPFNLSALNGSNGFTVDGVEANSRLGLTVAGGGDINGDGKSDVMIASPFALSFKGQIYVIFGQDAKFSTPFDSSTLNGSNGFVINGLEPDNMVGLTVSSAGDVNGDGKSDIIIGSYSALSGKGQAYVIFGQSTSFATPFDLTTLNGDNGFTINGSNTGDHLGVSVSSAGDINGDGKDEVILGASDASSNRGKIYVIFGKSSNFTTPFDLSTLNGLNGFTINGLAPDDDLWLARSAGDVNGDGKSDIIVGARGALSGRGQAYVVFGKSAPFVTPFNLATLDGGDGFAVNGLEPQAGLGLTLGQAGDINADGRSDIVIGSTLTLSSEGETQSAPGQIYVIYGQSTNFTTPFDLTSLNGRNGFTIYGLAPGDGLNRASITGDINGDGKADMIAGAYKALSGKGQAYVIYSEPTPEPVPAPDAPVYTPVPDASTYIPIPDISTDGGSSESGLLGLTLGVTLGVSLGASAIVCSVVLSVIGCVVYGHERNTAGNMVVLDTFDPAGGTLAL